MQKIILKNNQLVSSLWKKYLVGSDDLAHVILTIIVPRASCHIETTFRILNKDEVFSLQYSIAKKGQHMDT